MTSVLTVPVALPAQSGGVFGITMLFTLAVVAVSLYSSAVVVEDGRPEALFVLGEFQSVLEPGLNFVPPFVSRTYPVDPATETVDMGDRRIDVPEEHRDALAAHSDPVGTDAADDAGRPTPSGGQSDDRP